MPPTIILIRHSQGIHNTYKDDSQYPFNDPPLTELGVSQCEALSKHFQTSVPISREIELIVTSPMQRTLQTSSLALDFLLSRPSPVPVIALAELQETEDSRCDTGATKTAAELKEDWLLLIGSFLILKEAIEERGRTVKKWLKSRDEKVIAVVSHAAFMRAGLCGKRFANGDFRIFDFVEDEGNEENDEELGLTLKEWDLTDEAGGLGRSPIGVWGWLPKEERTFVSRKVTMVSEKGIC